MATLTYRRNNVMKLSGSYLAPAASYKVVAYPAGGMITNTETVTAVTVRAGHGLAGATKVAIYRPSTSAVVSGSFQTVTVSVNTVTFGVAVATVTGDLIINVSPSDTGTSTPLWTGSTLSIYADSAGASTALTKAQVTCNAAGEYEYWHNGLEIDEIIIDTLSVVTDCIPSAEQGPQMPNSVADNAAVIFDGTGGRQLKASVVVMTAGAVTGVTSLAVSGATALGTSVTIGTTLSVLGNITCTGGGIGYATGAGGTVTQLTSKSTTVILNKQTGQITTHNASLGATATVAFTLTDSFISANDILVMNHVSGGTIGIYTFNAVCSAGSAVISVRNTTAAPTTDAIVLAFALIKAVVA